MSRHGRLSMVDTRSAAGTPTPTAGCSGCPSLIVYRFNERARIRAATRKSREAHRTQRSRVWDAPSSPLLWRSDRGDRGCYLVDQFARQVAGTSVVRGQSPAGDRVDICAPARGLGGVGPAAE